MLRIDYHYSVPKDPWGGRTGWMDSPRGPIYSVAQWYPRMAVYDDIRGWDPLPYLAAGILPRIWRFRLFRDGPRQLDRRGLRRPGERKRGPLGAATREAGQARSSDKTIMIRAANEPFGSASGTKTWHFTMHDSRDVAFAASPAFVWDAARIRLPGGKSALAESVYPPEAKAWDRSTEYMKDAVEHYLALVPLSWPAAINVAGPAGGMEYPGIVFDDIESPAQGHLLGRGARDRARLVSDDRGLQRAPSRVDGRGLQHLHRRLRIRRFQPWRICAEARQRICAAGRKSRRRHPAAPRRSRTRRRSSREPTL